MRTGAPLALLVCQRLPPSKIEAAPPHREGPSRFGMVLFFRILPFTEPQPLEKTSSTLPPQTIPMLKTRWIFRQCPKIKVFLLVGFTPFPPPGSRQHHRTRREESREFPSLWRLHYPLRDLRTSLYPALVHGPFE